jgi:heat shock protein HslJ
VDWIHDLALQAPPRACHVPSPEVAWEPPTVHQALIALVILAATLAGCGAASDEDQLVGTHWRLAAFSEVTPAFQGVVPAEEQANYTIDFLANDAFAAKADCNLVAGAYTARRSNLTITPGPTTMAFCGEESYGELYVHMLSRAATYEIRREQLTVTLSGGANLTFTAMPDPSASATAEAAASDEPTAKATDKATEKPTATPTEKPTAKPTAAPTAKPTTGATAKPTAKPTASASASPGRTPPPASQGLLGYSWQLASITEKNPAFQGEIPADQRAKYTLEFAQDGTFSALADCNTVTGIYTTADAAAASGTLTITPGAGSAKACPDGSFGDLYTYGLGNVTSYAIASGKLTLTLLDDGQLVFE